MSEQNLPPAKPQSTSRSLPGYTIVAATVLVLFYIAATYYLYQGFVVATSQPAGSWERAQVLYNGIASIAFTAIGVLLGTQVQQVNVAAARNDAEKAKAGEAKFKGAVKEALVAATDDRGGGTPDGNAAILATVHRRLVGALTE